jgi:predicted lipoprotein with Yx(FWY)xxD motif
VGRVGVLRLAVAVAVAALVAPAAAPAATRAPVIKLPTKSFGNVLARRDHQALYYWTTEKKAGGKIRCTGACAKLWPPLLVKSAAAVPKSVSGIKGAFGVVRRPGGALQVTHNGLPVYTYVHEGPNQVLCDDVDGWFVVRV